MIPSHFMHCTMAQALKKSGIKDFVKNDYLCSHFLKPELFQMKMFFPFLTLPLCCDFWLAKVLGQVSPLCMTACLSIVPLSMSMSMTEYTLSDPYLGKTDDVFVGHVDVGVFSWLNNSINMYKNQEFVG